MHRHINFTSVGIRQSLTTTMRTISTIWPRRFFQSGCVVLLAVATNSCPRLLPGTQSASIVVDGAKRTFLLHLPPSYESTSDVPLLIALHPFTGSGKSMERLTGFDAIADREGFMVAYPDGRQRVWNSNPADPSSIVGEPADDVAFVDRLIDTLIADYRVDANRVFVAGASAGGLMAHRVAAELTNKFAGAASVMITLPESFADYITPATPLPFLMIHGKEDPFFPWDGGVVEEGPSRTNTYWSVAESIGYWVNNNEASTSTTKVDLPDVDPGDGTTVFRETFPGGADGADVVLYGIRGGGHTWPGSDSAFPKFLVGKTSHDINASETIWAFFSQYERR